MPIFTWPAQISLLSASWQRQPVGRMVEIPVFPAALMNKYPPVASRAYPIRCFLNTCNYISRPLVDTISARHHFWWHFQSLTQDVSWTASAQQRRRASRLYCLYCAKPAASIDNNTPIRAEKRGRRRKKQRHAKYAGFVGTGRYFSSFVAITRAAVAHHGAGELPVDTCFAQRHAEQINSETISTSDWKHCIYRTAAPWLPSGCGQLMPTPKSIYNEKGA